MNRFTFACAALALSSLPACSCDSPPPTDGGPPDAAPRHALDTVPETMRMSLPCLGGEAIVIRTEMDVPHVYASNLHDAYCVQGFIAATDRFFEMDMASRLGQGELSVLFGEAGLDADIAQRQHGVTYLVDRMVEGLTDEERDHFEVYAAGVNAYLAQVRAGDADPPSELATAAIYLGARRPADLMNDWDLRDAVSIFGVFLVQTGFETGDVGRARARTPEALDALFPGFPDRDLRMAGVRREIMERVATPRDTSSAAGWGLETGETTHALDAESPSAGRRSRRGRRGALDTPFEVLDRLERRLDQVIARSHRTPAAGYGSNIWAVSGEATGDGHTLLASDGHLQLTVPALFWQIGIDTVFLGESPDQGRSLIGLSIPGTPGLAVGTNGHVAWSQTAYFADVTDWYDEQIVLGGDGLPSASRFRGEDRPLVRVEESIEIRDVPVLMSEGRTETIARFTTFDGRWLTSIEGTPVPADADPRPAAAVNMMGDWIVPGDTDGDGIVSAVSFDYGPFDGGSLGRLFEQFARTRTVEEFRQAMRYAIGYGGSMVASDDQGDIVYTAYHAVPCRDWLPRDPVTNRWIEGADPRELLDGTLYGGWSTPLTPEGRVDEAAAATAPNGCVVPFDQWPQALSPARGYVHHANNDPGNITTDDDLFDDPYYIGGPWIEGYRGARIEERLGELIAGGDATLEAMQELQADNHSNVGAEWAPILLAEIAHAREIAEGPAPAAGTSEARIAAMFTAEESAIADVEARLLAWQAAGFPTPSGVETFYSTPAPGDRESAVATMIFNTWFPYFLRDVLNDERISARLSPAVTGSTFLMQTITLLIDGRGPGNPGMLGSYDPAREESVFFDDVRTTDVVETSHEMAMITLRAALEHLRSAPTSPGIGGFGSSDPDDWLWGLRHGVTFESLLGDVVGDDPMFSFIVDPFEIVPMRIPLDDGIAEGDPRHGLPFFPRGGDLFVVDAANPDTFGASYVYQDGPVFRMVIRLGPDGVRGENILPQGQSGLTSSPHFDDQVRLWLGNETIPMRYTVAEVVEGATGRETFLPPS
jgi:acyl-homoserine lactone acylase PvdQ